MKPTDFHIGMAFSLGTASLWRCTDIGGRTVIAVRLDALLKTVSSRRANGGWKARTDRIDPRREKGWLSGPPYACAETVLDEFDLEVCEPIAEEDVMGWVAKNHGRRTSPEMRFTMGRAASGVLAGAAVLAASTAAVITLLSVTGVIGPKPPGGSAVGTEVIQARPSPPNGNAARSRECAAGLAAQGADVTGSDSCRADPGKPDGCANGPEIAPAHPEPPIRGMAR